MSLGSVRKPAKKEKFGTTDREFENRRKKIYAVCALIILICGILDVYFIIGIISAM